MGRGPKKRATSLGNAPATRSGALHSKTSIRSAARTRARIAPGTPFTEVQVAQMAREVMDSFGVEAGDTFAMQLTHPSQAALTLALEKEAFLRQVEFEVVLPLGDTPEDMQAFQDQVGGLLEKNAVFFGGYSRHELRSGSEEEQAAQREAGLNASGNVFQVPEYDKKYTDSEVRWGYIICPNEDWAQDLYGPGTESDLTPQEAYKKLGDQVLSMMRMSEDSPETYQDHRAKLRRRADSLNEFDVQEITIETPPDPRYPTDPGTSLRMERDPTARFLSVEWQQRGGEGMMCANLPSEEVFTTPKLGSVSGTLSAVRPYVIEMEGASGEIIEHRIDGIVLEIEEGKVTRAYSHIPEMQEYFGGYLAQTFQAEYEGRENKSGVDVLAELGLIPSNNPAAEADTVFGHGIIDEQVGCHGGFGLPYEITRTDEAVRAGDRSVMAHAEEPGMDVSDHIDLAFTNRESTVVVSNHSGQRHTLIKDGDWYNPGSETPDVVYRSSETQVEEAIKV